MNKLFKSVFLTLVFASNIGCSSTNPKVDSNFTTGLKFLITVEALRAACSFPIQLGQYVGGNNQKFSYIGRSIISAGLLGGALFSEQEGYHKTALSLSIVTLLYLHKEALDNEYQFNEEAEINHNLLSPITRDLSAIYNFTTKFGAVDRDTTVISELSKIYNFAVKLGIIGVTGCAIYKTFNEN